MYADMSTCAWEPGFMSLAGSGNAFRDRSPQHARYGMTHISRIPGKLSCHVIMNCHHVGADAALRRAGLLAKCRETATADPRNVQASAPRSPTTWVSSCGDWHIR